MKEHVGLFLFLSTVCVSIATGSVAQAEDWKGAPEESVLSIGGLAGVGLSGQSSAFTVLGTASKKIVNHGFVPDITNSVSVEGIFGPAFWSGGTALAYGLHLRWDFEKDKNWTLYAVGGLGGNALSGRGELFPRFGVGAFYKMSGPLNARFELSHELIAVGVNVPFY